MLVKDAMVAYAAWLDIGRTVREAAQLMQRLDIGCLPVTHAGRAVGLITDRDIACRIVAEGRNPETEKVRAVMSDNVVSCTEDQTLDEAAEIMEANGVRRLPVLDKEGRIAGLISVDDIARYADFQVTGQLLHLLCLPREKQPGH
ncbi:CBS domain-containing protein [Taklimakanibacter deserti]|uniref:CBS domain-containing protein n=1 Tax=Taklimakanibacter deserti TaxID=2267839 RepID=UPI000E655D98